jgi:hypothetical protein
MKAYYLLAPLIVFALAGCAYESVYHTPAPTAYVSPSYVAPTYVTPSSTIVLGTLNPNIDSDGDGYANSVDRWPYDPRFH